MTTSILSGSALFSEVNDSCRRYVTQGAKEWKEHKSKEQQKREEQANYVIINVSGHIFKTKPETLAKYPDTLLGDTKERLKYYDERAGELFFDRHAPSFPSVLYYYQSNGQIHKPSTVTMAIFREELAFFRIKLTESLEDSVNKRWSFTSNIDPNPSNNPGDPVNNNPAMQYQLARGPQRTPSTRKTIMRRETFSTMPHNSSNATAASSSPSQTKRQLSRHNTPQSLPGLIKKNSDLLARYGGNSMDKITNRIGNDVAVNKGISRNTNFQKRIHYFLDKPESSQAARIYSYISISVVVLSVLLFVIETLPTFRQNGRVTAKWSIVFFVVEAACIGFFTLELVARFIFSHKKMKFCKNKLNIVDLISILPFYFEIVIPKDINSISSLFILRILRLFRVLRIFKLSRHSKSMVAFGVALRASVDELLMLGLFLLIDIIIFASALYYTEMDVENSKFDSIPASCWWAIVTVTTLGYGEMVPETVAGKIMAAICVFSGILVIAFQMPIMVAKFTWSFMDSTAEALTPAPTEYDEDLEMSMMLAAGEENQDILRKT